ncbi:MAG TPA: lysophospholipid acyltransferase family protein [Egibacteraceae bacterium]|nr:lysophospholipid acyltransferase family protein [Egibacteraceae bacterium]
MRSDERAPALYRVMHAVVPPLIKVLYRPEAEGLQRIPRAGPAILASNHLSFLDSVFLPALIDRPIYFLGKSDYFRGWRRHFFENVGVMPVNRQGGDAAEASLRRGREILDRGHLLGIYPEGTRSPDGRLYRGKTGPVRLALRTAAPLIPVAMTGTFEILPPGKLIPRIGPVGVRVGQPLDLSPYREDPEDGDALRRATDELMHELAALSGQDYVDEYAGKVKAGEASAGSGDLDALARRSDERPLRKRRAS